MFFAKSFERLIPMKKAIIPVIIIAIMIVARLDKDIVFRSSFTATAEPVRVFSIE